MEQYKSAKVKSREWWRSGRAGVVGIALATVVVHLATGWRYGFDRDELMALEDARHLAWGYVQYPPITAFFGWVALRLFGTSLVGFRFFAAVVQALALVLTGEMAKELGGGKWAQATAALAGVPFCLGGGALMQYISFDYVCWVLVAYGMVRVLGSEARIATKTALADSLNRSKDRPLHKDEDAARWWLLVGAGIGLGMMAKYTMGLLVAGVVVGVLATGARRYLRSGWLWGGVALAVTICLPNFLWEWNRGFESLEFLRFLHERDVQTGVTGGFFVGQLELMMLALPLAAAGLWFYFAGEKAPASLRASGQAEGGRYKKARYRALGWMYVVALALLVVLRGRDYYLAPAYPMLYAAGAVWAEKKIASNEVKKQRSNDGVGIQDVSALATQRSTEESAPTARLGNRGLQRWVRKAVWAALVADVLVASAVALPIAPVNSSWWKMASRVDIVFPEEIGWEEFTECVAQVWQGLSPEERARAGILAGNYGEVGALNLYGERWGLPRAMSGVNSSWERGYGDPAVETLVVVGYPREFLVEHFASCQVSGRVWNKYGVVNEETTEDAEIYVCRGRKGSWEQFWRAAKRYA